MLTFQHFSIKYRGKMNFTREAIMMINLKGHIQTNLTDLKSYYGLYREVRVNLVSI
jgi:hypothetical protein